MFCKKCGNELAEDTKFCSSCGTPVAEAPVQKPAPTQKPASAPIIKTVIPPEYEPLSPWAFFGLQLLYSVPIVGFIFMLIFTFSDSNLSRRNFTRSYWCALLVFLLLAAVVVLLYVLLAVVLGVGIMGISGSMHY